MNRIVQFLESRPLGQFIKYGLVGAISTAIDFIILNSLVIFAHANIYLSATAGFSVGLLNGYFLNRAWTFRYQGADHKTKFSQFALVSIIGLLLNNGIIYLVVEYTKLHYNYAKLIAVAIIFFWNYLWSRYWTFRPASKSA